jgi:prepilin-type N-terminal cleavage/methylation domain-containing protein
MTFSSKPVARDGGQDGFTLVETLVALVILGLASGLLVQSISLASGQIKTANRQQAAELLAVAILAELPAAAEAEGADAASGLYWQSARNAQERMAEEAKRAGLELVRIEVRPEKSAAPILVLKTVMMKAAP